MEHKICKVATMLIELNFTEDNKTKLKVSPIGDVEGLDGRIFKVDANTVIDKISKNKLHIPLDINHSFGEAVGWFDCSSFEVRTDGIYATLELNEQGRQLVGDRRYRYLSPVYQMDNNSRNVISLQAVGLVNLPNLLNQAINKSDNGENDIKEKIAMGTPEQISLEQRNIELEAKNSALETENNSLKDEVAKQKEKIKEDLILNAIKSGELLPANQEFAKSLSTELLQNYLQLQKVELNRLKTDAGISKPSGEVAPTDAELAVNKQLGIKNT